GGDPKLLFQVFSNLVSNAVKYSPSGGPIAISAGIESEQVVVAVEDHGIGIPAKDLDRLFERYHRGSNVSGIVGTGVGLYLVAMPSHDAGIRVTIFQLAVLTCLACASGVHAGEQAYSPVNGPFVHVGWQDPAFLPRRFRNHCSFDVTLGAYYCSDRCGSDYQF